MLSCIDLFWPRYSFRNVGVPTFCDSAQWRGEGHDSSPPWQRRKINWPEHVTLTGKMQIPTEIHIWKIS